ncbi:ketopantoate hydroxymethyltransferase [Sphaerosporella brunnea]|uniref:3-methyl-2-oxobutanoate hydroxymethyltransferase n=1 Tax=Sphaerosporella brunnea TaxID=1250544 RepID=A0A5J5EW10_9PEZI|nr:ketopantoate hydroxymethyltransferase [Sphaerosporella brunnea]
MLLRHLRRAAATSTSTFFLPRAVAAPQCRHSSHSPLSPTAIPPRKKVTINTLRSLYAAKTPITMITAHDFPSGLAADLAGVDIVLVGDSLAMVALGMEDTNQLPLSAMLHHSRAVARAIKSAFLVTDLPMGSYEVSAEQAIASSIKLVQEGRTQAVKLEGGAEMAPTISRLTSLGIPVLGHIGLTPQRQSALGGFRVQGKTLGSAQKLLADALALQQAGCFALVVEAVPEEVARIVTDELEIPTIGIGAGKGTSGQVLVQVDMLGYYPDGRFMPKFVKRYANLFEHAKTGIEEYMREVRSGEYPQREHTYPMSQEELEAVRGYMKERKEKE